MTAPQTTMTILESITNPFNAERPRQDRGVSVMDWDAEVAASVFGLPPVLMTLRTLKIRHVRMPPGAPFCHLKSVT